MGPILTAPVPTWGGAASEVTTLWRNRNVHNNINIIIIKQTEYIQKKNSVLNTTGEVTGNYRTSSTATANDTSVGHTNPLNSRQLLHTCIHLFYNTRVMRPNECCDTQKH